MLDSQIQEIKMKNLNQNQSIGNNHCFRLKTRNATRNRLSTYANPQSSHVFCGSQWVECI